MSKKFTVVIALTLVLGLASFYVVQACNGSKTSTALASASSCSKSASTASADADCEAACAAAAASVTAGKADCCKSAVSAVMASWSNIKNASVQTANASSCSKTAAAKTANASSCSKTAAAKYAQANTSSCSKSAGVTTASADCSYSASAAAVVADKGDCCKQTVAALADAVFEAKEAGNGTKLASSSYSKTANANALACTKGAATTAGNKTAKESKLAGGYSCSKSASAATFASINKREGSRIVLTGNAVCAHCDLEIAESCNTLFQTAEGKIYPLLDSKQVTKLRKADKNEAGFQIVTYVRKHEGDKVLDVKSFKTL